MVDFFGDIRCANCDLFPDSSRWNICDKHLATTKLDEKINHRILSPFSSHTWRHLATKKIDEKIDHRNSHSTVGTSDSSSLSSVTWIQYSCRIRTPQLHTWRHLSKNRSWYTWCHLATTTKSTNKIHHRISHPAVGTPDSSSSSSSSCPEHTPLLLLCNYQRCWNLL